MRSRKSWWRNEVSCARAAATLQTVDFAIVSAVVPVRADVFGICDGSGGAVWRVARRNDGGVASVAVPSVGEGWVGCGGEGWGESHSFAKDANEWGAHDALIRRAAELGSGRRPRAARPYV